MTRPSSLVVEQPVESWIRTQSSERHGRAEESERNGGGEEAERGKVQRR